MFSLKNDIFEKYFPEVLHTEDPNKDGNGKGTTQRFVETLVENWDDDVVNTIDNVIENTLIPSTVKDKFIPYLEKLLGLKAVSSDIAIRRRMLERAFEIYKHKGTKKSYDLIFKALGFDAVEVIEGAVDFGFDSSVRLDHDIRTFDLGKCYKCRYYTLNVLGNLSVDNDMYNSMIAAISIIEPIYARLYAINLNSVEVNLITMFIETNGDLVYTTLDPGKASFSLSSKGDLYIFGEEAEFYTLDANGDLIYNNEN